MLRTAIGRAARPAQPALARAMSAVASKAPKPFTSKVFKVDELKMAGTTEQVSGRTHTWREREREKGCCSGEWTAAGAGWSAACVPL